MAALELPDRPGVIEAQFVKGTAAPFAEIERLEALDALAPEPLGDKAGILPVADPAFGERDAARG